MGVALVALEFDAQDPGRLAGFWAAVLGRRPDATGTRLPGLAGADFEVRFIPTSRAKSGLHRMHFDLTSDSEDDQRRRVELASSLGGRHRDVGQRGDEGHVVLADPEDNEFCVIEAGNRFLATTARIGALAGDGMPEVGYFWSRALEWPLVWDENQETAIQSPRGGTKLTWGGPPVRPKTERNRLRWVLAAADRTREIERLCSLGAVMVNDLDDRAELADPEGNEFIVEGVVDPDGSPQA